MAEDFELAIVGAGPAGSATALFLLHERPELAGRIALIDRARFPRDKICAGALGGRALRALGAIGVRLEVPRIELRGLGVVTGEGRLCLRQPEPIGWVVRRRELDAALVAEAVGRGAQLIEGAKLERLEMDARRVRLHTSAGPIAARALVGADGIGSATRRLLGLDRSDVHAQAVEVDTPFGPDDGTARDVLWFDLSGPPPWGYGWDFPTLVAGRALVCRGVYAVVRAGGRRIPGLDPAEVLARRLDALGLAASPLRRFAERGLPLHAPLSRERALLVGEAAGIDPVLGEGIAQAILYGQLAGRYLAARADGGFASGFGDWRKTVLGQRLGWDLKARRALLPLVYGTQTGPLVARWVGRSSALAASGAHYFAGDRVPRKALLRALFDLSWAAIR